MTGVAFNADAAGLGECGGPGTVCFPGGAAGSLVPSFLPPFLPGSRRSRRAVPGAGPGAEAGRAPVPAGRAGRGVSAPSLSDNFLSKPQGGRWGLSRGERGGGGGSK